MKEGYIDKFDIERITRGVEEKFDVEQAKKGRYVVQKTEKENPEGYIVDLNILDCSCNDYEYNCSQKKSELGDVKVCKHIYHCIFRVHSLL